MSKNSKLVEVIFKGERRVICRNRMEIDLSTDDYVVVEADRGKDMGRVSLVGSLVNIKKGKGEAKGIIRKAEPQDLMTVKENEKKEKECFASAKDKIIEHRLDMKLVDIEMQFDGSKITFFFTAGQRIDFRGLVKDLAGIYKTRIELRQIGVRDEARRIPGMGICGRTQCCSAFLTEFEQITTQMAKDQQLSLNPTKISGNCGRLLCCMKYEHDMYLDLYKDYPGIGCTVSIEGKKGIMDFINIFKNQGHVRYEDKSEGWHAGDVLTKGKIADAPVEQSSRS